MADEADHDALNHQLARWDEIGKLGVFGLEEGLRVFDEVTLQGRFAVDEGGDDVARARFTNFEDDEIAIADKGADHGFTTHLEREAFGGAWNAEGVHIDGDAFLGVLHHVCGRHAGGDLAEDGNVDDFSAIEILGEDDGTRFVCMALNNALLFQRSEMAHGSSLTGEAEVALDVTCGGHDSL